METIIIKLGGSVVTQKQTGNPKLNKKAVLQIAKEIKFFVQRFPKIKIILLHGAGSFGHPLVYRYKILEKPFTEQRILGFSEIICSTRKLANLLTEVFLAEKLPVVPIQASAMDFSKFDRIKQVLKAGFIPMLGGDMGLEKNNKACVVSADKLAVLLAKEFEVSKIFFATDVGGVFDKFPASKNAKPISFLDRKTLKNLIKKMSDKNNSCDVTGSMQGKLKEILKLSKKEIIIFNGLKSEILQDVLQGKILGTRIVV